MTCAKKRNVGRPCCCDYCEIMFDDFDGEDLDSRWIVQNGSFALAAGDLLIEGTDEESRAYWSEPGCFVAMVAVAGSISVELYSSAKIFICQGEGINVGYLYCEIEKTSEAEPNDYTVSIGEADGPSIGANETVLETDTFSGDLSEVKLCFNAMLNKLTLEIEGNVILEGYPTVSVGEPTGRKGGLGAVHVGASTVTFNNFRLNRYDEDCETCNARCPECCTDDVPGSLDVTIPQYGFENGDCDGCESFNEQTYNLLLFDDRPIGFLACELDSSACAHYQYRPGEPVCSSFGEFSVSDFTLSAALESSNGMCRMVVNIIMSVFGGGGLVSDFWCAVYASEWEYPDTCAGKEWTCDFQSENAEDIRCNEIPDSVTVEGVAA